LVIKARRTLIPILLLSHLTTNPPPPLLPRRLRPLRRHPRASSPTTPLPLVIRPRTRSTTTAPESATRQAAHPGTCRRGLPACSPAHARELPCARLRPAVGAPVEGARGDSPGLLLPPWSPPTTSASCCRRRPRAEVISTTSPPLFYIWTSRSNQKFHVLFLLNGILIAHESCTCIFIGAYT
jgi:hypothetical protein